MLPLKRKGSYLMLLLIAAILFGLGVKYAEGFRMKEQKPRLVKASAQATSKKIFVHVAGAVENPGLYELSLGSRIADAIKLAVPSDAADLDRLNLAAPVADGEKITVSDKNIPQKPGNSEIQESEAKVSINEADINALDKLPGIGPALAKRIVDYRGKNGPFTKIEDLRKVSGIGKAKFEELKDSVTLY